LTLTFKGLVRYDPRALYDTQQRGIDALTQIPIQIPHHTYNITHAHTRPTPPPT